MHLRIPLENKANDNPKVRPAMAKTEKKKGAPKGKADETDVFVGQRLRALRDTLGLSQEKLAETVGITFQQVQKYENGSNRIAAGRLYQIAEALEVPVSTFFPGADEKGLFDIVESQKKEIARLKAAMSSASRSLAEAGR